MSRRMTAKAFGFLERHYPDDFENMYCLEIEVGDFNLFRSWRRSKKKKTKRQLYGEQLTSILEWLDENCSEPYFPRLAQNNRMSWNTTIQFYFMDDADAMAFKLMFT